MARLTNRHKQTRYNMLEMFGDAPHSRTGVNREILRGMRKKNSRMRKTAAQYLQGERSMRDIFNVPRKRYSS